MKALAVRLLSMALDVWYRLSQIGGRRQEALFLSRQSDSMTLDFQLLSRELGKREGWTAKARIRMVEDGAAGAAKLVGRMFGDVRALARCRICFVEGYNPAVSLLHMKYDAASSADGSPDVVNGVFPAEPVVMQVWHAAGHFKKFGYEALGTSEGRSAQDARIFRMHRNYSWVVCSGEGARAGFANAFGCPEQRVVALGHPSFDELYRDPAPSLERVRAAYPGLGEGGKPVVVFAPTIRRQQGEEIFENLKAQLGADSRSAGYDFVWSFHPVTLQGSDIRVTTRDLLCRASLVVTDYSSIVYDAALLDVPFAFYVPDIEEYRQSLGLATDPGALSPGLCLKTPDELFAFLGRCFGKPEGAYPAQERDAFIGTTLSACGPGSTERIVDFALAQVGA